MTAVKRMLYFLFDVWNQTNDKPSTENLKHYETNFNNNKVITALLRVCGNVRCGLRGWINTSDRV